MTSSKIVSILEQSPLTEVLTPDEEFVTSGICVKYFGNIFKN